MDRILLGKAPANTQPYYHRDNKFGLFISKPGSNVYNCSDGDLMFDSTAASLMQTITKGMAVIPKAVHDVGIFGERGIINDSNWNSAELLIGHNSDNCWLYDALKQIETEAIEIYYNHTATSLAGTQAHATSEAYLAEMAAKGAQWAQNGEARPLWDLQSQFGVDAIADYNYLDFQEHGADSTLLEGNAIAPFGFQADNTKTAGDLRIPLIMSRYSYGEDAYKRLSTIYSDSTIQLLTNLGGVGSLGSVQSIARDLWRMYDVFPFLNIPNHILGSGLDFITSLASWPPADEIVPNAIDGGAGGITSGTGGVRTVLDVIKPLSTNLLLELLDGGNFDDTSTYPYFYDAFKSVWTSDNLNNSAYVNKTAYSVDELLADSDKPVPWRAWTTPETGKYNTQQELAAIARFYKILFLFSWMYHRFAYQAHNGLLDYHYDRVVPSGTINVPIYGDVYFGSISNVRMLVNTTCPSAFTSFTQYNPTNNFTYTEWSGGEVDVVTGVKAPNGLPIQVWWNPAYSGSDDGPSTNLSFLNIKENRIKTSTKEKRLNSLVPGLPNVQANTYVEDGMLRIKFIQPSVLDETTVYFTGYKEPAFLEQTVDAEVQVQKAPVNPSNFVDSLAFIITDTDDPTTPGDNYAGRRADDGRYYTVVFPDDFVGTKFTSTDPLREYRNTKGLIDQPLMITLNIPAGVTLSGNSFHNHIQAPDLPARNIFLQRGSKYFGPSDSANRRTTEVFAANDPCIKLNLHSKEITDQALSQMLIRIENNGTMIGAGGWGSYGQMNTPGDKFVDPSEFPGGGGGGGAGYHPTLETEDPKTDWVGEYTTPPSAIDGVINSESEIASAQVVAKSFWNGPNNYVEWGRGGNKVKGVANTYYTGMDYITWKSIGPGKPGTGYLGATPTQITYLMEFTRPYSTEQWDTNVHGSVLTENQYARIAGTYVYQSGIPRFNKDGWGNPGTAGTPTSGGAGGGAVSVATFGWNQHGDLEMSLGGTAYRIDWDNPANPGYNAGNPSAGSGGSCVYLFANTTEAVTGTQVQLINNQTGIMKAGGGGGSGGDGFGGLGGGNLGRPGKYIDGVPIAEDDLATTGQFAWNDYSRRGEPGRLVWWNSENVQNNYTIVNYSTNATHGSIEGLDYNESIGDEDYVSYLPDARIKLYTSSTSISGKKMWSRKRNSSGDIVYNTIGEKTYEEYVNDTSDIAFIDE